MDVFLDLQLNAFASIGKTVKLLGMLELNATYFTDLYWFALMHYMKVGAYWI